MQIELGSSQYTKFSYPAGEIQVRLTEETLKELYLARKVDLIARITQPAQVVELALLADAVDNASCKRRPYEPPQVKRLILPYYPFSRADREFVAGDCVGVNVFSRLISSLRWDIYTLDVHSQEFLKNYYTVKDVSPQQFVQQAIRDFSRSAGSNAIVVLFPDEGARKRYKPELIPDIAVKYLHCTKKRDPITGSLSGFEVPDRADFIMNSDTQLKGSRVVPYPTLIVDDICDGGGTFLGIVKELEDKVQQLGLYVTHGIFSKGTECLLMKFDKIYFTDSFQYTSTDNPKLHIFNYLEAF